MDLTTLPSVPFSDRIALPRKPGVYVVSDSTGVVYVGQAKVIRDRWRNHHRAVDLVTLPDVRIAWIETVELADRLALEGQLTQEHRPRFNNWRRYARPAPQAVDFVDDGSPMVGASEAIRVLNIPRTNFYRAVKDGKIPVHEVRQPWNRREIVKRFRLSEIRDALGLEQPPAPT